MTLPSSGQLSLGDIANEFGFTDGSSTKLGDYRTTNGQGNFPVSFGALSFSSIDGGGSVPTSGEIKFSDFYSTRLQSVVNFYGSGRGGNRLIAKDRYNAGGSNDVNVVGNYRTRPNNTSGTKVHIHVNQSVGSEKTRVEHCALRTGSWDSSTILQVDVGGSGRIIGGGGDGGNGRSSAGNGSPGGNGTSGLGIQYSPTQVNVASGGFLTGGFAGGGGGGGGYDYDKRSSRHASGGGGGGGAGIPAGNGGARGTTGALGGNGSAGNATQGGEGGNGSDNGGEAFGGAGGDGGQFGNPADNGVGGSGGEGSTSSGGSAGTPGAAIRRNSGFTVNITNNGNMSGSTTATTVL